LLAAMALVATACVGGANADDDSPVVERSTIGDTTIVRTVSGSAWADTVRLVEELRIGALEGPEELTFGRVDELVPDAKGGIDIFDSQAIALRRYDSAGKFVKTIGGKGQGPGEYNQLLGLGRLSDGRLVAYDGRNTRITTYAVDGTPLETWPLQMPIRVFTDNVFAIDRSDHVYVYTRQPVAGPPGAGARGIMLRIGEGGRIIDTLPVPEPQTDAAALSVCLRPSSRSVLHPSGQLLTAVSDAYSLDLRQPNGTVLRIQRAVQPVAFEPGERAELEDDIARSGPPIQRMSISAGKAPVIEYGPKQTVPPTKPIFRNIVVGNDGRIWVQLHAKAEKIDPSTETVTPPCNVDRKGDPPAISWREPILWDVFEENGDYLGVVAVPPRTTLRVMNGDTVWAVQRGESDEEYVVRYRLAR